MPYFSIIVPVYNSSKTIYRCLLSIQHQTFADFEVIAIDDGSTDDSESIYLMFAKKDKRFSFCKQTNNGPGSARNKGISLAKGRYIVFVDSDDYIEPEYLYLIKNNLSNNPDIAFVGYVMESETGTFLQKQNPHLLIHSDDNYKTIISKLIANDNFGYSWCKVIKNDFLKKNHVKFETKYFMHEDLAFICNCLEFTRKIVVTNGCLYHYIKRPNSLCSTYHEEFIANIEYVNSIYFDFVEKNDITDFEKIILERSAFSIYLVFKNYSLASKKIIDKDIIKTFLTGYTVSMIEKYKKLYFKVIKGKKKLLFFILAKTKSVTFFMIVLHLFKIK